LMDILPMYVLFSFLTPAAFGAAQRWGWNTILFVSFSVWVIAQTQARQILVTASKDLPFVELGPFDLLAWQLLWVGGLFIGQRFLENRALLPTSHLLRTLLVLSATVFLCWRWISITNGPDPMTETWLFDKWHLGPLRQQSARPITPAMSAPHQISLAETRMKRPPWPSRTVRQPVLHPH
jgi:hypothetical protein